MAPHQAIKIEEDLRLAVNLTAAVLSHRTVSDEELPNLLLLMLNVVRNAAAGTKSPRMPTSADIRASIGIDHLICLLCGTSVKTAKRHLREKHALSPEQYREKLNLGSDYPMVAASYSKKRSKIAKTSGLGSKGAL